MGGRSSMKSTAPVAPFAGRPTENSGRTSRFPLPTLGTIAPDQVSSAANAGWRRSFHSPGPRASGSRGGTALGLACGAVVRFGGEDIGLLLSSTDHGIWSACYAEQLILITDLAARRQMIETGSSADTNSGPSSGRRRLRPVLFRFLAVKVKEMLAGEIVGHGAADGAQLLQEPAVLLDQLRAPVLRHLEDVGIIAAVPPPGRGNSRAA